MAPLGHTHLHAFPAETTPSRRSQRPVMTVLTLPTFLAPSLTSPSPLMAAVHCDHDYVLKDKAQQGLHQHHHPHHKQHQQECDEGRMVVSGDDKPLQEDALLSSSAIDLDSLMNDIDFSDDLADLNLGLTDLEANTDFSMGESFEDFIDSALDKSFCPSQWDVEERTATERADKEDFMRALGLTTAATSSAQVAPALETTPEVPKAPESSSSSPSTAIPTKECTCSQHSCGSRAVYTTAGLKSPHVLSSSTSQFPLPSPNTPTPAPSRLPSPMAGSCLNCFQNRKVLEEFSKPLTIDVSSGVGAEAAVYPPLHLDILPMDNSNVRAFDHRLHPGAPDPDADDLLLWLASGESRTRPEVQPVVPTSQPTPSHLPPSTQGSISENLDQESFMDLEDFLNSVESDADPQCQPTVQHDHTYQKTMSQDEEMPFEKSQDSHSRLSFPSTMKTSYNKSADFDPSQDIQQPTFMDSNPSSPVSSLSPSPLPSPAFSPNTGPDVWQQSEKNRLDILNFFSDDFTSSLLNAGSPLAQLRFM